MPLSRLWTEKAVSMAGHRGPSSVGMRVVVVTAPGGGDQASAAHRVTRARLPGDQPQHLALVDVLHPLRHSRFRSVQFDHDGADGRLAVLYGQVDWLEEPLLGARGYVQSDEGLLRLVYRSGCTGSKNGLDV